ncbi:MAG: class I SAM-dependent methyltransferase, partial [Gammaproteobacteria bacterium]|nr:class I SAM-dependent methyltransferase [Gammaproteobacteria bacterium]
EHALASASAGVEPTVAAAAQRCRVLAGDSLACMRSWQGSAPGVVYLDPMYAASAASGSSGLKTSAAVNKNMRLLQLLSEIYQANYLGELGEPQATSAVELLAAARQLATVCVVVKRPPAAPPLAASKPSSSLSGKAARFDIYAC